MNREELKLGKIDGMDLKELAKEFGTPLYIYSKKQLEENVLAYQKGFLDPYERTRVAFASKAFSCKALYQFMAQRGIGLDVVSGGEIFTAKQAKIPMETLEFNGNNKEKWEIELALEEGIGLFIVDSLEELYFLEKIAKEKGKVAKILFRLKPNVETDTHAHMSTGHSRSKFGISRKDFLKAWEFSQKSKEMEFRGIHIHVGSQLKENTSVLAGLKNIFSLLEEGGEKVLSSIKEINLGGGLGISYVEGEKSISVEEFYKEPMKQIEEFFQKHKKIRPWISIEPGRSLVGEAGITLYEVGTIKEEESQTFMAVNGGMSDNLRVALYGAKYEALAVNKSGEEETVQIVGKCCETGDVLIQKAKLPEMERGDLLVILATGAYHYSMANNYNKNPIPPVICVEDGKAEIWVKGQTMEELIQREQ